MIKRSESKSNYSPRKRSNRMNKKRRLMMEGLEKRELLAGDIPEYTGPRNIGTVQAFAFRESETIAESRQNDFFQQADFVPLGTGPGQHDTIDVTGSMSFTATQSFPPEYITDVDTFKVTLRAGDILDIATLGSAGTFNVLDSQGQLWFGVDDNQSFGYPGDSPLQNSGLAVYAQVVPRDGDYYITLAPTDGTGALHAWTSRLTDRSLSPIRLARSRRSSSTSMADSIRAVFSLTVPAFHNPALSAFRRCENRCRCWGSR